jgi:hypothetical protein
LAEFTNRGGAGDGDDDGPGSLQAKAFKPNEWNDYRVRAEGRRVQIWINGTQMTDWTEAGKALAARRDCGRTVAEYERADSIQRLRD